MAVTLLTVDDAYLMNLVRCTGALVALVASFLAAPEATRHFWARLRMPYELCSIDNLGRDAGRTRRLWSRGPRLG
ncbi:MAG TPA: hypothetical protein VJ820_11075 [Propionibacteriaceae bacterium]|nr:hypothetical protein [Propionibacteriaceae bacterium]